jgi:hypothetical protein
MKVMMLSGNRGGQRKTQCTFFLFIAVLKLHGKLFLVVHVSTQGVKRICLGKSKNANKQSWKHKVEASLEARWLNTSSTEGGRGFLF